MPIGSAWGSSCASGSVGTRPLAAVSLITIITLLVSAGQTVRAVERERRLELGRVFQLRATFDRLIREEPALRPTGPGRADAIATWIEEARSLAPRVEALLTELENRGEDPAAVGFLASLKGDLSILDDPATGLLHATTLESGRDLDSRLRIARRIDTFAAEVLPERYRLLRSELTEEEGARLAAALDLARERGLVPLDRDPASGLLEFAHLPSGEPALRDPGTGRLVLTEETGIVLVLVPGGRTLVGVQADDPDAPRYDPDAELDLARPRRSARPRRPRALLPVEVRGHHRPVGALDRGATHLRGDPPRRAARSHLRGGFRTDARAQPGLEDFAQGPDAARPGPTDRSTARPRRTGWNGHAVLERARGGVADRQDQRAGPREPRRNRPLTHLVAQPGHVRRYLAGLMKGSRARDDRRLALCGPRGRARSERIRLPPHLGNVREWCLDTYGPNVGPREAGTGRLLAEEGTNQVHRGGCYYATAWYARCGKRSSSDADYRSIGIGIRPVWPSRMNGVPPGETGTETP